MFEQVKGKVKIIKEDRNRRAIILDNGKRWFSVFKDTKGFPEATGIVEKIDNNVSVGDSITLEVVENDKGFWNIRGLYLDTEGEPEEAPASEETQGILEEQEEQQEKPAKKATPKPKKKTTDIAQSTLKAAVETVALYDLNGQKEEIDAEVQRIWGEYFQRVLKLG